ncbi:hypothetical protein CEE39_08515 [bacterium (candidate division B38) B3_B38]|nr:MAG: hypothetical protein CEE39_08515 [bacterium (candidate division B38) B3_B38]
MSPDEFNRRIESFLVAMRKQLKEALTEVLEQMAEYARSYHPYKDRSGALTRSIHAEVNDLRGNLLSARFIADAPYASEVEYGTSPHQVASPVYLKGVGWRYIEVHPGAPPRPFMRPALEAHRGGLPTVLEQSLLSAAREVDL